MTMRNVNIDLQFQEVISGPPQTQESLWQAATSNDDITIQSWKDQWLSQMRANKEKFGSFKAHGIGKLFNSGKVRGQINNNLDKYLTQYDDKAAP